ncbi:LOW QUALITY PROTEIN: protein SMAX1-LIKE 3 [Pyrus x bretschneideri]|uniref:LOW QUALITY PROTEIN: protein SMAX1-LIKE 3 n=1 Tax=Pyrus x bretschneideri TaxID=225117 RepID=UPI002030789C|nr:LOW QUALITY PROTEIN: protein SMAX1-LIKE 3 [Pyrus x bretschneideri]
MRAGGCTLQQGLTTEAANILKQAVTLARHRGHAQVTPLHVASTMLSSSTGLLRTACLQSHSHPLQCKALELCFNVALNRLPASNSSPMLGSHPQHPSISNALVAAFKRAQAHQRRGSIENQQQPLLAVKIELEQLIISILDDPSVSRVMREAGFSSTQVKSNVEQAVSLEICNSQAPSVSSKSKESNSNLVVNPHQFPSIGSQIGVIKDSKPVLPYDLSVRNEDVACVIENLVNKRRKSIVVVGECLASVEGVVRGVMEKVERGDVEALREVKFRNLTPSSFRHLSRVEVEQKLGELKSLVRSCVTKGVILYVGDLKWTSEYRASSSSDQGRGYYCPVEHMIMELGNLLCGISNGDLQNGRLWIVGMATFQTYMRCKSGHPSLETVWGIHPLTIPSGSLRLSLVTDSHDLQSYQSTSKIAETGSNKQMLEGGDQKQLTCCAECSAKFEAEARNLQQSSSICNSESTTSSLPAWLQQYKNENKALSSTNDQNSVTISDLCKKWNSICGSMHQQHSNNSSEKTLTLISSLSPSSSTSNFSYEQQQQNPNLHHQHQSWRHQHFWISGSNCNKAVDDQLSLRMYIPENNTSAKQPLSSNPNSTPTSASSSDIVMETDEYIQRFKELNAENLKILCSALESKVPWQKDIFPEIASTILKCRSGMVRRKGKKMGSCNDGTKEETWLFFQGVDMEAKLKVARELARLVFGSQTNLTSIALSSFSSTRADSTDDCRNKRSRDEQSCSYVERFADAVSFNPHRVFLVEDVEQADYCSQMGFKRAIERGRITNSCGEEVGLGDAIIILSCESFSSRSRACSPPIKQKLSEGLNEEDNRDIAPLEETSPCVCLDLNISFDDDDHSEYQSIDDIGLLESVDRRIVFKIQEV